MAGGCRVNQVGENKLHPLEIAEARQACHRASEFQRDVEDKLREAAKKLAAAERLYRRELRKRTLTLHVRGDEEHGTGPLAITTCEGIARGEEKVSSLRYDRDIAQGEFESLQQEAYRRGADRKDVHQLLTWSEKRDLRTDAEPADWSNQQTHGQRVPDGVDPNTGEIVRGAA